MKVAILGNGPSLNNISLNEVCQNNDVVIGCNRIFLHDQYANLKKKILVAFSDKSFKNLKEYISNYVPSSNTIFSSDLRLNNKGLKVKINRGSKYKGIKDFAISNIINYPNLFELSSVISTIVIPYTFSLLPSQIDILGVDMNYFINGKFNPYFYKKELNQSFKWTSKEAKDWSEQFNKELSSQIKFFLEKGIQVK